MTTDIEALARATGMLQPARPTHHTPTRRRPHIHRDDIRMAIQATIAIALVAILFLLADIRMSAIIATYN